MCMVGFGWFIIEAKDYILEFDDRKCNEMFFKIFFKRGDNMTYSCHKITK